MLSSQIFTDDEWHSLRAVIGSGYNYGKLLAQFDLHDNSSLPLNLYALFLYQNYGWSEMLAANALPAGRHSKHRRAADFDSPRYWGTAFR